MKSSLSPPVWLGLCALLAACPGAKEKVALAALSEGCNINSDCSAPNVCAFRRCHQECNVEADCQRGPTGEHLSCVPTDQPYKICLLPTESHCVYNTDCLAGLVCAVDLRCRTECRTDRDCVGGQVCADNRCANPEQLSPDGGLVAAPIPDGGVSTEPCQYNSDCPSPLACRGGACLPECRADRDCPAGDTCDTGRCVFGALGTDGGSGSGRGCLINSDCSLNEICGLDNRCRFQCNEARDCAAGACCYQHGCRQGLICTQQGADGGVFDGGARDAGGYCLNDLACDDGDFCNGIELCVSNTCQPALHPICDDSDPCTTDMCNAVTHVCSYAGMVPDAGDNNHDGHKSYKCGGYSDDCDDNNPNVYFGHPEECDGLDNNCNGAVDEGLWREQAGARISLNGAARFPSWAGTPRAVPVDGGYLVVVASDTIDGALEAFRVDATLTLQQGPVQLFGSTTQWVNPVATPALFGRRMLRPTIAINPAGQVLTTGWMASAPGVTTCPSSSYWTLATPVYLTDALLGGPKAWEPVGIESVSCPCPNIVAPEAYYPRFSAATLAWSPAVSRWLAIWGENTGSMLPKPMYAAYYDADGGIAARHPLLTAPDSDIAYDYYYSGVPSPLIVPGASNVMVAFNNTNNRANWVLMDPSLNSRVTQVYDVIPSTEAALGAGAIDGGYYLLTRTISGADAHLRFISSQTGAEVDAWTIPAGVSSPGNPAYGYDSTEELPVVPYRDGIIFAQTDWPNLKFGYLSGQNDGGAVTTKILFPATPRSGFEVLPLADGTIGLLWTDGQLKRTIMECAP